jgi:hypothetical protein
MKYDFIIQGPTAKQLEDDGYFMNVSKYAKLFGIQPEVRITTGVNNLLAQLSGDDQGFDEWHDELDSLLTCFKEMIINLSENKGGRNSNITSCFAKKILLAEMLSISFCQVNIN